MDHINLFQTNAEFLSAYTNDYVEPWVSFTMETSGMSYNKGPEPAPSHDYVEIGGIKWATMNLGATAVTDYGKYYAWGETQGYAASQVGADKNFTWADYELCDGTSSNMTKYNSTDRLTTLQPIDDAVTQEWGGNWRMPTVDEMEALRLAINTAWTSDYEGSGVAGLVCTDINDSSKVLFFPAAGSCANGLVSGLGIWGDYWESSVFVGYENSAYILYNDSEEFHGSDAAGRHYGYSIRGILDE